MIKSWALCVCLGWAAAAAVLGGGCGAGGDPEEVSRRDCERLRDHVLSVRLESVTADVDQHRAALAATLGASYIDRCVTDVAPDELRCLMKAGDAAALASCGH